MARRKKQFEHVRIIDIADKGRAMGKTPVGEVILVEHVVPGDVVDVITKRKRKGIWHCIPVHFHKRSADRTTPFCRHFGICGGCKWQNLDYDAQLAYKYHTVKNALVRIAKIPDPVLEPIAGAGKTMFFRNKLEFTFSDKGWLTEEEISSGDAFDRHALGFHVAGAFAHVVHITQCHLQPDPSNAIRNAIHAFALERKLDFQNIRTREGLMRNVTIRTNRTGDVMLIFAFLKDVSEIRQALFEKLTTKFSAIRSIYFCINQKANDTILDLPLRHAYGDPSIREHLHHVRFDIGPKSFFQTNPDQAERLYALTKAYAGLTGNEVVYDLYCGLGSISLYIARDCKFVYGFEEVADAVEDARKNARLNHVSNTAFFAGDVRKTMARQGIPTPDVMITDPPRAGMHADVIRTILTIGPGKIVYVSCNPATQARDIALLSDKYQFVKARPVDMFPHTSHIENVSLLKLKTA